MRTPVVKTADRVRVTAHAAPQAISLMIRQAAKDEADAHDEYVWLTRLYKDRMDQIESGEWPPVSSSRDTPSIEGETT